MIIIDVIEIWVTKIINLQTIKDPIIIYKGENCN